MIRQDSKIDLDRNRQDPEQRRRGISCWKHKGSGQYVYMYNSEPGIYLTEQGTPVSEDMAREAGADTEKYAKQRKKEQALAAALAEIEAATDGAAGPGNSVILEKDGWKLVSVSLGNTVLFDPDGTKLTATPFRSRQARCCSAI